MSRDYDAVTAARDVAPLLRAHSAEGERRGALAEASLAALRESGLLKLWRPRSLGGHELAPLAYALAAEEVGRADSAAAWMMMGVANTTFDLRLADASFVEEVFANPDAVICETFNRPLSGKTVEGGYRVTGSTPFASGCRQADWIGHTAVIDDAFLLMFHPADALTIEDDWHTLGMRGTASNTIAAEDVFVPSHRVIDFAAAGGPNRYFDGPLYRLPEGVLTATFSPVSLGLLSAALDAATERARVKQPFAATTALRHRPLAQLDFGRALATYRAARALYHGTLAEAWRRVNMGEPFTLTHKADLFLACAHVLQSCAEGCRLLARVTGSSSIYEGDPVERALRDTQVIAQHAFGAQGRFATVAQAYWDVEVDFPLLAMD